jgi:putative NIF3 family GTP cyclohydrolase 1 type 2
MTLTIQQAIDTIIAAVPGAPFAETVDTVKVGDASQPITSIAVTFMATPDVIRQAAKLGANFLITHEPTFYNHLDSTEGLTEDPTYLAKKRLLEESKLVVWRFHDYLHSVKPDRTLVGLAETLGWTEYGLANEPFLFKIPALSFGELQQQVKEKFGIKATRVVGDPNMTCRGVGLLPGFPPAKWQIMTLGRPDVDVLITGEIHEWETSEYARDSNQLGHPKGLIVMGHSFSEEDGIEAIVAWLQEQLPGISIQYIPTANAFQVP